MTPDRLPGIDNPTTQVAYADYYQFASGELLQIDEHNPAATVDWETAFRAIPMILDKLRRGEIGFDIPGIPADYNAEEAVDYANTAHYIEDRLYNIAVMVDAHDPHSTTAQELRRTQRTVDAVTLFDADDLIGKAERIAPLAGMQAYALAMDTLRQETQGIAVGRPTLLRAFSPDGISLVGLDVYAAVQQAGTVDANNQLIAIIPTRFAGLALRNTFRDESGQRVLVKQQVVLAKR